MTDPSPSHEAAIELARVVDRLRSMPLTRLAAPWPPFASRSAGARALAQEFADRVTPPRTQAYVVPDVGDAAVGDQVAVTGRDLLTGATDTADLDWMAQRLREVRLSL